MKIKHIEVKKDRYLPLLLLADDHEHIMTYLAKGELFVLMDQSEIRAVCVVSPTLEIENLAVASDAQGQGYGRALINYLFKKYKCQGVMTVGTDGISGNVLFYEACGFEYTHKIKNYFIDHYSFPIYEDGKQLKDKCYLRKEL
ncbi:GNAT family N-acetyltransferase [Lactococcus petauri]|uniref:GNAT family N-acetyltransferase n=1 Tax=Lactococcus petauri TaxID=1940789 RepID=UPI0027FC0A06|nr:GNAT family N-acetyltransferase [Lactococcus petauri]MDQ7119438.1 GNAT family N-acetyltransferase [Lactococcus petauri]MDQ7124760.1 GNAT family N-acetyltransferase [Lactococcus petauri]MDQ7126688.1 GNAT family N-acetyltransferase [Lactococcus petauri]MDQ7128589.1 GNAT family N-acetyltransferase [Lactococcus petauri]MDQ7138429.1 GNAT family N-acetyltransferase [Lactococcus petauri]